MHIFFFQCFGCLLLYLLCFVCSRFIMLILFGVCLRFVWLIAVPWILPGLPGNAPGCSHFAVLASLNDFRFTLFSYFVLPLVVVFLVLIIFTSSRERNNQLRRCLFLLMARLLVTGFFGNTFEKIC